MRSSNFHHSLLELGAHWPIQPYIEAFGEVFDAGTSVRKVLGCRVSLNAEAAWELGKICFRHIFESEEEEKERLQQLKWYEERLRWLNRLIITYIIRIRIVR